jgi:alpha-galactosidase
VAEKFGLFFPVGDTTGAPGLMRGLRAAITFAGFGQAIAEHCPQAWVINYTNPMSVCTRSLTKVAPGLKVFGCCHEVFSTQTILAELAQEYLGLEHLPERDEIRVNVNGINHFTWIDQADYQGHDLLAIANEHILKPGVQRVFTRQEVEARESWFFDNRQIKYALFERYGILAAAGDRHLSEFVPGFTHSPEVLFRWGVIRTPVSYRKGVWEQSDRFARDMMDGKIKVDLHTSGEEAVRQIKALVGLGDFVTNVNFPNLGQAANLPAGAVVETNAHFSRNLVQPVTAGELPSGVQALISRHISDQEMIIQAALERDKELAFQAVFNDPTTNLSIDRAWEMFEEIGLPANW